MKNKESRSVANGFTSISTKISAKEDIYTSTCVARKRGVNVIANKPTGDVSPTVSAFSKTLCYYRSKVPNRRLGRRHDYS
jgi:hypothetical protein